MTARRQFALGFAAIGVAFATMTYELTLAQALTSIYGGAVTSYSMVIGVFVLSLGLGAAFWARGARRASGRMFWTLEMLLAGLGLVAPFVVFRAEFGGAGAISSGLFATVFMALAIGTVAGMEIPLLVSLAGDDVGKRAVSIVVGLDFLGTFAASLVVPLLLFPAYGLVGSSMLASFVNLAMAAIVLAARREFRPAWPWAVLLLATVGTYLAFRKTEVIEDFLARGVF